MANLLHEDRLRCVHPALVLLCKTFQVQLMFAVKVLAGVRTDAEQAALYAQGRTAPGNIVTNAADATKSPHGMRWVNGRALGMAIDICPVDGNGNRWDDSDAYEAMAAWASRRTDIEWGGRWPKLVDKAHFEIVGWRGYPPANTATPPDMSAVRENGVL